MEKTKYDGNKTVNWSEVGWQPKEIKAPGIGQLRLAAAIRIGASMTPPATMNYFDDECRTCAVGAAFVGHLGRVDRKAYFSTPGDFMFHVAGIFGVSTELISDVSHRYENGSMSREQIADWLEAQGY